MQQRSIFRSRGEAGSVMVIALLVMVILSLLGVVLLTISSTESNITYNALWTEGAFYAGEAGVHTAIDRLSANLTTSTQAIPVTSIGGNYTYRSGRRSDAGPQPLQFVGTRTAAGYSIGSGMGYNQTGYAFYAYQINATGMGPRNAQREIEVLAQYGPVAQ